MKNLIYAEAKQIDLVDYLASLGHLPQKVTNQDYWYLSPLRDEKTPSFKVNRPLNIWYDHGTGKGGILWTSERFILIVVLPGIIDMRLTVTAQPKNVTLKFQLLLFPEQDAKLFYRVVFGRWFL